MQVSVCHGSGRMPVATPRSMSSHHAGDVLRRHVLGVDDGVQLAAVRAALAL